MFRRVNPLFDGLLRSFRQSVHSLIRLAHLSQWHRAWLMLQLLMMSLLLSLHLDQMMRLLLRHLQPHLLAHFQMLHYYQPHFRNFQLKLLHFLPLHLLSPEPQLLKYKTKYVLGFNHSASGGWRGLIWLRKRNIAILQKMFESSSVFALSIHWQVVCALTFVTKTNR